MPAAAAQLRLAGRAGMLALVCCVLLLSTPARGNGAGAQPQSFDIPAQPLALALQRYANDIGATVFFDNTLTAGKQSRALHGMYTAEQALSLLLDGSGLEVRHISATAFTLIPRGGAAVAAGTAAHAAPVPGQLPALANPRALQSMLEQVLCKSPQTRPGTYRALIQLWIDPAGVIRRSALLASTGLAVRDEALRQALSTLVQRPSREDAVQPVAILLLPRTDGVAEVCVPAANDF